MYCLLAIIQFTFLLFAHITTGNVEKTIFVAPQPYPIPAENPALDDLGLERLSPTDSVIRAYLNASFPTDEAPQGSESWFYLEGLNPGQRYEVRICWLATQPTAFTLTTYTLLETISDPNLLSRLSAFSIARLSSATSPWSSTSPGDGTHQEADITVPNPPNAGRHHHHHRRRRRRRSRTPVKTKEDPLTLVSHTESVLFLCVFAAADYFTLNTSMMETVPPVLVDVILDPLLLNVFPRSLVPTAAWTLIVAALAYFIGGWVVKTLNEITTGADNKTEPNQEENKKKR